MSVKKNTAVFFQLLMPDGLEIITRAKAGDEILVRTIIHPGSLISHVTEKALETPGICNKHFNSIYDKLESIKGFRKYLNFLIQGLQILSLILTCFLWWKGEQGDMRFLIIAFGFSIFSLMAKTMLRLMITYYIRRKIKI
ncbi:hypothetical protein QUF70_06020 [Desulfobacterales bacterium HSG17]|nr:hypothetical protein [Desulfobacterales bacterium HSG17]